MEILCRTRHFGDTPPSLVLVFGSGLIGASITDALAKNAFTRISSHPVNWLDIAAFRQQLAGIQVQVRQIAAEQQGIHCDVVWAAGKLGFGGAESEFELELLAFAEVLQLTTKLREDVFAVSFHMMSSAGGLFEAQRFVGEASAAIPLRAYGHAKVKEEAMAAKLPDGIAKYIYRPSSVYGYSSPKGRTGLIVALIQCAISRRVMNIYGGPMTLRDFVFADDIGAFVVSKILSSAESGEFTLANGKPTSMAEIVELVQSKFDRPILRQYTMAGDNVSHNSFRLSALPAGWKTTPLQVGVAKTATRIYDSTMRG